MLRYIYHFFKFILSVRLSNSLRGSDVLLFLELINTLSIFVLYLYRIHYFFIQFISDFLLLLDTTIYDLSDLI